MNTATIAKSRKAIEKEMSRLHEVISECYRHENNIPLGNEYLIQYKECAQTLRLLNAIEKPFPEMSSLANRIEKLETSHKLLGTM